jgi:hypothetical protein
MSCSTHGLALADHQGPRTWCERNLPRSGPRAYSCPVVVQRCRLASDWGSDQCCGPGTLASGSRTCGGTACDNSWPLPTRAPPVIPQSPASSHRVRAGRDGVEPVRPVARRTYRIDRSSRVLPHQRIAGCLCGAIRSGLGSCRLVATPLTARTAQPQVPPSNNSPLTGNRHAYTGFERRFVIRVGVYVYPHGWGN